MKVKLKLISYCVSTFLIFGGSQSILFAGVFQDSLLNNKNEKEIIENKDSVNFMFKTVDREHLAGDVIVIDIEKELNKDQRTGLGALITGKVPGVLGARNVWGIGQATVFVDGME